MMSPDAYHSTGLDKESLAHCLRLLEEGHNPDALAVSLPELFEGYEADPTVPQAVIRDLRAEAKKGGR